jgi:excinuclease ABC subunit C
MDLSHLPHSCGVYLMKDALRKIIYIGKANDLRKRVSSYFLDRADASAKISAMVPMIRHIDYIPTESERDTLILEQKLIRRFQPFYNTLWRDDKTYPFVKLTAGEDFPRLLLTRTKKNDGGRYYGPFSSVKIIRSLLKGWWQSKLFPLRPCEYDLTEDKVSGGLLAERDPRLHRKVQSCIYLHTGDCPAPCMGKISKKEYGAIVEKVERFFDGDYAALSQGLRREMKDASDALDYERAALCRDQIKALDHIAERIRVRKVDEESVTKQTRMSQALTDLQKHLELPVPPMRIECFDISNIQGTESVASMVVFDGGQPARSEYRKFKIKTVQGADDFASMEEVVTRRYLRLAQEKKRLPNLVLIDGGKGQLASAVKAFRKLKQEGYARTLSGIQIASLAKQEEEVFRPGREDSIRLPKDSAALHVLQHIRDEAHRFAITYHRQRRNKAAFNK